jgi:hypothetical protein
MAQVRQEIGRYMWKKSTTAFQSKMRQSSLEINQSCSNRSRVQIILHFNSTYINIGLQRKRVNEKSLNRLSFFCLLMQGSRSVQIITYPEQ